MDTQPVPATVQWSDLSAAEQLRFYPSAVRSAFGMGHAPDAIVRDQLMPPMRSLQAMQLEITSWCNFACRECGRTKSMAAGTWRNMHMPLDRYQRIVAKLPPTERMFLQGVGEPSMHPDFVELVRLAHDSGKFQSIHFNTNGHTHDDAWWTALGAFPNLVVALSVDSLDPVIAERCRSGTKADVLWSRLQLFQTVFRHFNVALVASRMNLNDLEQTLRKIGGLGRIPLAITRIMSDDPDVVLQPDDEAWIAEIVDVVRRDLPNFPVYFNRHFSSEGAKRCVAPFLSPFVTVDGYLTPCCSLTEPQPFAYTPVDDERTWDEIRTDPRVLDWVSSFIEADPVPCQGCSLNPNQVVATRPDRPHEERFGGATSGP